MLVYLYNFNIFANKIPLLLYVCISSHIFISLKMFPDPFVSHMHNPSPHISHRIVYHTHLIPTFIFASLQLPLPANITQFLFN